MMSKASFMMQEHLRRSYVMVTDVSSPSAFFVRGRLPFPQGLLAIAVLFKNQRPADVYAHPYFIEKQSDPAQPSPQLHLTEESQGIMKVMSGLRYMRDDNTKLDSTMVVVTDYKVEVKGRMPVVPSDVAAARAAPHELASSGRSEGVRNPLSPSPPSPASSAALTLEQRAHLRRPVHQVSAVPGGGRDVGLSVASVRPPSAASASVTRGSSGGAAVAAASASPSSATPSGMPGYSTFPTPEDCVSDAMATYTYLKAALQGRRAVEEGEAEPAAKATDASTAARDAADAHAPTQSRPCTEAVASLFETRRGGYTVVYNPIEVNERTFTEVLLKLKQEERVVKAIVVPTRPAWRHLQVWADVFPDAELIASGEVPILHNGTTGAAHATTAPPSATAGGSAGLSATSTAAAPLPSRAPSASWRGGCEDLGNGVTGLSFPEVDLEAEAALERQRAADAVARAQATASAAAAAAQHARRPASAHRDDHDDDADADDADAASEAAVGAAERTRRAMLRRQREKMQLRREMRDEDRQAASASAVEGHTAASSTAEGHGSDLVDVLWHDVSFFTEKRVQKVGLRARDAARLRVLSPTRRGSTTESPASASSPSASPPLPPLPVESLSLTPTIELLRVPGDAVTEEYVLYDANSRSLACTDLYHGEYADLDPANSWMCRVWFKFMKRGDYKRTDRVPRYKWLQVMQQHSLTVLQRGLDELTRRRAIQYVVCAHGTPPLSGPDAVNTLRRQWNLAPLHPSELPKTGGSSSTR